MNLESAPTQEINYAESLVKKQMIWWKRILNVQAPYRWNLRHLKPGFTLEIGCGIGRNLLHLKGEGVGLDHNIHSVKIARSRGLKAFTPEEFKATAYNTPGSFDSLLLSHVAEHLGKDQTVELLKQYAPLLKPGGKLIIITPQEVGYRSDSTHQEFLDFEKIKKITKASGFAVFKEYSFPFPRVIGHFFFRYNEFVCVSSLN